MGILYLYLYLYGCTLYVLSCMVYISCFIYILDDTSDVPLIILWTVRTVPGFFDVLMIGVLMFWFKFEFGFGWFDR